MNLILLTEDDLIAPGKARITGRRLKHIREVHRAKDGDVLCVGLLGSRIGSGRIIHIDRLSLEMAVSLDRNPPEPLPHTLILALPRPKALRRVLFSATAMGVKRIFLVNAFRVEKSYWQSPFLEEADIEKRLILGLEQARDTILPEVRLRTRFKPFVQDELPGIARDSFKIVAHPTAVEPFPRNSEGAVSLAIGPEGGFIPYEVEMLESVGFRPVNAGARILPVETAVPFLISRIC